MPSSATHYKIAEIGGDGIGPDVAAEAVRVLAAAAGDGLHFSFERGEVGAALYQRTGEDLPRDTVNLCRAADAILFGARTRDIGGTATTRAAGEAVIRAL